jgi:hypothetical protein
MPLTGFKLFGSTVKSFSPRIGWGTETSSVKVSLVQDTDLGDYFLPPPIGTGMKEVLLKFLRTI